MQEKILLFLSAVCALLFGFGFYEKKKNDQLKAEAENQELKKQDAVLKDHQEQTDASIAAEKQKLADLQAQHSQEDQSAKTPEEIANYFNKK